MTDYTELKRLAEAVIETDRVSPCDSKRVMLIDPAAALALIAENERLEGRVASEQDRVMSNIGQYAHIENERDQLKADNEALRKDADRWQIVDRAMTQLRSDEKGAAIWSACSRILISVANELNSSRSVVTEEGVTSDGVEIGDWRVTVERIDAALSKGEQP